MMQTRAVSMRVSDGLVPRLVRVAARDFTLRMVVILVQIIMAMQVLMFDCAAGMLVFTLFAENQRK